MKRRICSRKDGTTFREDMHDIGEEVKAFLKGLPAKIKALLPEAEDFACAVQALSDAVKDGQPADIALRAALEFIPGEADTEFYEQAKQLLEKLAIRLQILLDKADIAIDWSTAKRETAVGLLVFSQSKPVTLLDANLAVETAVYYLKS